MIHYATGCRALGSFTVSGDRMTLFNDPNCIEDVGAYTWSITGDALVLKVIDDPCAIDLRAKNLTSSPWTRKAVQCKTHADQCQPPSLEAAVSDHWPKSSECH
jgi:hypothetical protein